ncbi:MAG TPA: dihydrodipicolinate synthase family protein [Caldilineaceae bacterium]|nr:dihydrodipicolinate synthase family protein [Caldilineaceae bacterium]
MPRYPQAILVSCEIPWDEKEQLIEAIFRREVRMILAHFNHLYLFGTAGEGYAIDTSRFQQIVRIFHEETRGPDVHPMIGVIGLSTATVVERIAFAYDVGFRIFQISLPAWGALNDHEMMTFFRDVCGAFPDAQFLHYNLPRAKRVLTGHDYRRLIDAVPNLVATKNTGGGQDRAADLMTHAAELQHFFGEANFPHGCLYGECSLLSSCGPMSPHKAKALFDAGRNGQWSELFQRQKAFHDMLHTVLGPRLADGRIDGAYDKMLVRLGGLAEMPLRLLSPYQCFSEEEYQACRRILHERFGDWVHG